MIFTKQKDDLVVNGTTVDEVLLKQQSYPTSVHGRECDEAQYRWKLELRDCAAETDRSAFKVLTVADLTRENLSALRAAIDQALFASEVRKAEEAATVKES